jgi:hypothetical protein
MTRKAAVMNRCRILITVLIDLRAPAFRVRALAGLAVAAGACSLLVAPVAVAPARVNGAREHALRRYVDPFKDVSGLTPRRIDLGVDYAGSGPLLALGRARVTMATDADSGPQSCWAISCWPGGGIVVYRLLDGPFAGRYVYVAEHLTVSGWAAGPGPEALAMADGHRCPCGNPGGWSTIEGRNMDRLLVGLGAPPGSLQAVPDQHMPADWPSWPA